jgi:hypothetical protein
MYYFFIVVLVIAAYCDAVVYILNLHNWLRKFRIEQFLDWLEHKILLSITELRLLQK